jgi:uncharacterized protein
MTVAPTPSPRASRIRRAAFLGLGWLFFGLGAWGAFLPVLPTTPFMILALWAFSRSSERLHGWLYGHRIFGPPLQRWQRHRVIPIHAKIAAVAAMTGSLGYMIWVSEAPAIASFAAALLMAGAAAYILSRPSRAPGD